MHLGLTLTGDRVIISPEPRGKILAWAIISSTLVFPALWSPTTTTWGWKCERRAGLEEGGVNRDGGGAAWTESNQLQTDGKKRELRFGPMSECCFLPWGGGPGCCSWSRSLTGCPGPQNTGQSEISGGGIGMQKGGRNVDLINR